MTSSTWTCDVPSPLIACGVDCESVARFAAWAAPDGRPPSRIFSAREVEFVRMLPDPAAGLCACFGCKEAVLKGFGEPYRMAECELFPDPSRTEHEIELSADLRRRHGVARAIAAVRPEGRERGEVVVVAYLLGNGPETPNPDGAAA
jgi:phosphopantetheinyl transferase (holo-ACP synthase)